MMNVNVEAFILCWNEEALIRHTLNHYASFCSKITLIDNYSTDRTIDIVKENFPATEIIQFDSNNEIRDDLYLVIKNNCWKESTADYVIVCDTDELLYADDLQGQLALARKTRVALPVVTGYDMGSAECPGNYQVPIYKQVVHGVRNQRFDKQIIFDPRKISEINFKPGAHACNPVFRKARLVDKIVEFKLLHYKYLGKDYLYKKHEDYAKRMSELNKKENLGNEYLDGKAHIDRCFAHIDVHLYQVV